MKSKLVTFFLIMLPFASFGENNVVYSENFENASVTETTLGNAAAMNYGGGALWTFGLETNYPIDGAKSAYFNITNTGSDWWTLQYRIDSKFAVKQGAQYKVSFKIQSSIASTIKFRVEATADFTQMLNLKGGYNLEEYSITTSPMDRDGDNANFMFAFGSPAVPTEIWLDDIVIEELGTTAVNKPSLKNFAVHYSDNGLTVDSPQPCSLEIFDTMGKLLASYANIKSGETTIPLTIRHQVVLVKAQHAGFMVQKKVLVN
ncbi:MAG: hypothetical protein Q8914_00585 [Bacteroidota bacterium]|nr:hypothetical protein [Bacteroidota bacterium]